MLDKFTFKDKLSVGIENTDNNKHVFIWGNARPEPQPRITRRSRFANKHHAKYISWRNEMRDLLKIKVQELWFPEDAKLGMSCKFGAKQNKATRKNKDGSADKRTMKDIYNADLANYLKAWEDVCNGIVYKDDKQIRLYDSCTADDNTRNYFWLYIWTLKQNN
jgi:Holliday junction resolvase RusA-like endonuclease